MPTASGHTTAITASKVIGAPVQNAQGDPVGTVEDLVLDKLSDRILFAVVGFSDVLGYQEKYHPLPWALLTYDKIQGAYRCDIPVDQLRSAPTDTIEELTRQDGNPYKDRIDDYYGMSGEI